MIRITQLLGNIACPVSEKSLKWGMRMRRKQGHNEIDKISASFTPDAVRINVYSKNN